MRTLICAPLLALRGVIHRGVDGDLLDCFGGRSGQGLADGSVTEVLVWMEPPGPKFSPVFRTKRFSPTWLVEFPLKRFSC